MNGTLYCGVTNNLGRRVWEHREGVADGFTKKYHVHRLVWFEQHHDIREAITRETQIKAWKRGWKVQMIEQANPAWDDLFESVAWSS